MKLKSVQALKGGEILGESLLTKEKQILIPRDTEIREEYLPLLNSLDIKYVMVEDPYEKYEQVSPIVDMKDFQRLVNLIQFLMEKHIYHNNSSLHGFEPIANEIVKDLSGRKEQEVIDLNERPANLYEHTAMVTYLTVKAAMELQMDRDALYEIALGCLLHDIGLRYITTEYREFDWENSSSENVFEMKKHTILGYSALDDENWLPDIAKKMVLAHHETQDGSGYPMHLKYKEQECKLIQVMDSFDGMISGIERKRTDVRNALDQIKAGSGTEYDKKAVKILLSMAARYPAGTQVGLNTGEEAVVTGQTSDAEKPIVMVMKDKNKKYNLKLEKDISILRII